jgi:hypothetical protein
MLGGFPSYKEGSHNNTGRAAGDKADPTNKKQSIGRIPCSF